MRSSIGVEPESSTVSKSTFSIRFSHGAVVSAWDEAYSDRLWCEVGEDAALDALPEALIASARERERGRVVAVAPSGREQVFSGAGFVTEGVIPGYYRGRVDCAIMGWYA